MTRRPIWFEIYADDIERARVFYHQVFGWRRRRARRLPLADRSSRRVGKSAAMPIIADPEGTPLGLCCP